MCLIVTFVMLILSIQNLLAQEWVLGLVQLLIALAFLLLLWRNIQLTRSQRNQTCKECSPSQWLKNPLNKKEL